MLQIKKYGFFMGILLPCILLCILLYMPMSRADAQTQSQPQASPAVPPRPVLNQIIFDARAEQWVSTKTAQIMININATMNENALAKAHNDILQKLQKLADTDWHIVQFDRTPNQSGLEQLLVQAEGRVDEKALADVRTQAKAISKPGETFTVQSIAFSPTLAEEEAARAALRKQVYAQIQQELVEVNKAYPNQRYVVHEINFTESNTPAPMPRPRMMMAMAAADSNAPEADGAPLTVANKMVIAARIKLVSVNQ